MKKIGIIIRARHQNCEGGKCFRALKERVTPPVQPARVAEETVNVRRVVKKHFKWRLSSMKKTTSRFWVDVFLFISMSGLFFTGIIMTFFTDSGPYAKEISKYFFRLHRHQWGNIHLYFAIVFLILLVIHLIFEWEWIKGKTRNLFKKIWILIPIASATVVILFISWYMTPKYTDYYKKHGKEWQKLIEAKNKQRLMGFESERNFNRMPKEEDQAKKVGEKSNIRKESDDIVITGQHSLSDIERTYGISARKIAKLLSLPDNISLTERLGRLRKQYSFSINDVRDIVYSLMGK